MAPIWLSPRQDQGKVLFRFQGFTTPMWSWTNSENQRVSLEKLQATGANSIILDFHLSTESLTSSVIEYSLGDKTLAQLNEALETAKAHSFDLWFKPVTLVGNGVDQNRWQHLSPDNTANWFFNYKDKLLEIAHILEKNSVSHFILTNELFSMTTNEKNVSYWLDIISSIREVYSGNLGFNCGALLGPWANGNEVLHVPQILFDASDFIGLSSYPRLQDSGAFTFDSVTGGWLDSAYGENLAKGLANILAAQEKPVYFTELGSPAYEGGNYSYGTDFTEDLQGQANFYSGSLEFLNKHFPSEMQGVFIYNWLLSEVPNWRKNTGSHSPYDWSVNGKPAQLAIAAEYLKSTPIDHFKIHALPFSQEINGSGGIDTVFFDAFSTQVDMSHIEGKFSIRIGPSNYEINAVERISFKDKSIAFDSGALSVAKLLGAVFGAESVSDKNYVGIGLSLHDGGMSYQGLAALAVSAAGKSSSTDVCTLLWTNVMGSAPTTADITPFKAMLDSGQMSIGSLTTLAADTSFNTANIGLVGLSQTGLEFV